MAPPQGGVQRSVHRSPLQSFCGTDDPILQRPCSQTTGAWHAPLVVGFSIIGRKIDPVGLSFTDRCRLQQRCNHDQRVCCDWRGLGRMDPIRDIDIGIPYPYKLRHNTHPSPDPRLRHPAHRFPVDSASPSTHDFPDIPIPPPPRTLRAPHRVRPNRRPFRSHPRVPGLGSDGRASIAPRSGARGSPRGHLGASRSAVPSLNRSGFLPSATFLQHLRNPPDPTPAASFRPLDKTGDFP